MGRSVAGSLSCTGTPIKARVRLGALHGTIRLPGDPSRSGGPTLARSPSRRARRPIARAPNASADVSPQFVEAVPDGSTRASYRTLGIAVFNAHLRAWCQRASKKVGNFSDLAVMSRCIPPFGTTRIGSETGLPRVRAYRVGTIAHPVSGISLAYPPFASVPRMRGAVLFGRSATICC